MMKGCPKLRIKPFVRSAVHTRTGIGLSTWPDGTPESRSAHVHTAFNH